MGAAPTIVMAVLLASGWAAVPGRTPDAPFTRVEFTGGLTPFRSVVYEVFQQGSAAVATHGRDVVNQSEHSSRIGLMAADRFGRLLDVLRAMKISELPDAPAPAAPGGPVARVSFCMDGKTGAFTVSVPEAQADRRYAAAIDAIRAAVIEAAGDLPFQGDFLDPGTAGTLYLETFPCARAMVDGKDTGLETPIRGLALKNGSHRLRLVNDAHGIDREYDFGIEPGMTTILTIDLR